MVAGALIQMATVGLILGGAAIVLFGSMFHRRLADPMGMFGLPSVCAIASRAKERENRATRPIEIVSRVQSARWRRRIRIHGRVDVGLYNRRRGKWKIQFK